MYYYITKERIPNIYRVFCMESRINVEHTEHTFKRHSYRSKCKVHSRIQVQVPPKCCKNFRKCGILLSAHFILFFHLFFFSVYFFFFFSLFLIFLFSKWLPDNEAISSTSHSPVRKGRVTTIMNHKSERIPALFFASQATTHAATYQRNNWQ